MMQNHMVEQLVHAITRLDAQAATGLLMQQEPADIAQAMQRLSPVAIEQILHALPDELRQRVFDCAPAEVAAQWRINVTYPAGTVGSVMEQPKAVFPPTATVSQTIETLRELVRRAFITYVYVTDEQTRLVGLVVMRELMLASPDQTLADIMIREPFSIQPDMTHLKAMRAVLSRHFPVYPVTDDGGRLVGLLRGATLFEKQAVELTAQAGSMVGVEKQERVTTAWVKSLRFRQPWLQFNLLTAFAAAVVVGSFEGTINRIVVLAAFLPVLAAQSGNTGSQAMAITVRAMTLGDMRQGMARRVVVKEAWLGLLNGLLTGIAAAGVMYFYSIYHHGGNALALAIVVCVAMVLSCVVSGVCGVLIPLTLKRLGFDPAAAASIFLTNANNALSMGVLLGLATMFA